MANVTIDQLPLAGTALDGTEEVPIWVAGVTEKCTTQDIADLTTGTGVELVPYAGTPLLSIDSFFGLPTIVEFGGLRFRRAGFNMSDAGNFLAYGHFIDGNANGTQGSGVSSGSAPSSSSIAAVIPGRKQTSSAAINSAAEMQFGSSTASYFRARSGIANKAGFLVTGRVSFDTIRSDQALTVGLVWTILNPNPTQQPSINVNCIQFAKDETDVNLQLMYNNGSGTCTKVDLGVAATALAGKLLEFFFIVDPDSEGTMHYRLQNLEAGGATYEGSVTGVNIVDADAGLKLLVSAGTATATATAVSCTFYNVDFMTQY